MLKIGQRVIITNGFFATDEAKDLALKKELKNGIQLVPLLSYLVKIVMKMKLYTKKNLVKNTICLIFIESN